MTGDPAKAAKQVFGKANLVRAGKVVLGIGLAEGANFAADKAAENLTDGRTKKIPHEVGGAVVAIGAAMVKQPAVAVGGLSDLIVNGVRDITGLDVTKPADAADKVVDRAFSEDVI